MSVLCGLDVLLSCGCEPLRHKALGVLAHSASISCKGEHVVLALRRHGLNVARIFSPEHGLWGVAQDMESVTDLDDPIVGQRVISLYGEHVESLKPEDEALCGLDAIVIDLQDVGARYYTYNYTAWFLARAALDSGREVYVLDRPNPLGDAVEGNTVHEAYRSFVGEMPIATRHGMTLGELLLMWARENHCAHHNLHVVRMKHWERAFYFEQCALPWVAPSPNMPTINTALVYPGMCLLEGTNLSEARGTTRPFEQFGAPWLQVQACLEALESLELAGVFFRPIAFRPMFQKYAGTVCRGLEMHVTDRAVFRPLLTGLAIVSVCSALHPKDFLWRTQAYEFVTDRLAIDLLLGNSHVRAQIETQENPHKIWNSMQEEGAQFRKLRRSHLLY